MSGKTKPEHQKYVELRVLVDLDSILLAVESYKWAKAETIAEQEKERYKKLKKRNQR